MGSPREYITGQDRNDPDGKLVTHLYDGTMNDPGQPMCARGWNRANGHGYSIWRNNIGAAGVCRICVRRAGKGLPGVPPRDRKTQWL